MFIKKEHQTIEREDLKIKTLLTFVVEDMWYEIIVNQTCKDLVSTIYNHPNRNINDFVENITYHQNLVTVMHTKIASLLETSILI